MKIACPNCGANVEFLPDIQKCYCEHCGKELNASEFKDLSLDIDYKNIYDEYTCSSCSAKLITDSNTIITDCIYCGSRQLLKNKIQGEFKPEKIIPFKIDKEKFISLYEDFIQDKKLAPKKFKNDPKIHDIKGLYVPYYLFYNDIRVRRRGAFSKAISDKNTEYKYFEKEYRALLCSAQDASYNLEEEFMESLGTYNLNEMVDFNPAYLNGFLAERMNESKEKLETQAIKRCVYTIRGLAKLDKIKDYNYSSGITFFDFKKQNVCYALLPVWFFNTKYGFKKYSCAINGQNGKIVGNIPISIPKLLGVICSLFLISTVLTGLAYLLINLLIQNNNEAVEAFTISALINYGISIAILVSIKRKYKNIKPTYRNSVNIIKSKSRNDNFTKEYTKEGFINKYSYDELVCNEEYISIDGGKYSNKIGKERIEKINSNRYI